MDQPLPEKHCNLPLTLLSDIRHNYVLYMLYRIIHLLWAQVPMQSNAKKKNLKIKIYLKLSDFLIHLILKKSNMTLSLNGGFPPIFSLITLKILILISLL